MNSNKDRRLFVNHASHEHRRDRIIQRHTRDHGRLEIVTIRDYFRDSHELYPLYTKGKAVISVRDVYSNSSL